jgi:hypothetical protein
MLPKFFVTNQRTRVVAALLPTFVWDCTRPIEIRLGRIMMYVVGLNKSRHQAVMVPRFVTLQTEWLMHLSLNGVYHFPEKKQTPQLRYYENLKFCTKIFVYWSFKSYVLWWMFVGHGWIICCHDKGSRILWSISAYVPNYMAFHPKRQQSWSML